MLKKQIFKRIVANAEHYEQNPPYNSNHSVFHN